LKPSAQTNVRIQQPVKSLRSLRQLLQAHLLQGFGERIKERPHVSGLECFMSGLSPFLEYIGDVRIRTDAQIDAADNQIVALVC
jgi:hypothetical protein